MGSLKKFDGSSWINSNLRKLTTDTDTFTTFPAIIYAEGTNATVGLKGNTVQNGTPTPDSPVMPQGTGERTGNLFDKSTVQNGYYIDDTDGREKYNAGYVGVLSASDYIDIVNASNIFITDTSRSRWGAYYDSSKTYVLGFTGYGSKSVPPTAKYVRITVVNAELDSIMLNTGSTALPYEPYGYKIPISSANTTTPVYLGEVETTRKIKKLVLTGEESWSENTSGTNTFRGTMPLAENNMNYAPGFCTHVEYVTSGVSQDMELVGCLNSNIYLRLSRAIVNTLAGFKTYLQQQYAAGTPVTVWYVLANETTAVVNEPLMKISDYADTVNGISIPVTAGGDALSVGTTVQPSEVTANYYGWHTITVHERESGQRD